MFSLPFGRAPPRGVGGAPDCSKATTFRPAHYRLRCSRADLHTRDPRSASRTLEVGWVSRQSHYSTWRTFGLGILLTPPS